MAKIPLPQPTGTGGATSNVAEVAAGASRAIGVFAPGQIGRVRTVKQGPTTFMRPYGVLMDANRMSAGLRGEQAAARIDAQSAAQLGQVGSNLASFGQRLQDVRDNTQLVQANVAMDQAYGNYRNGLTPGTPVDSIVPGFEERADALQEEFLSSPDYSRRVKAKLKNELLPQWRAQSGLKLSSYANRTIVQEGRASALAGANYYYEQQDWDQGDAVLAAAASQGLFSPSELEETGRRVGKMRTMADLNADFAADPMGTIGRLQERGQVGSGKAGSVRGTFDVGADDLKPHLGPALQPHAQDFVDAGKQYGLDPRFLAAISKFETGNGTSSAFRNKNNAMGISNSKGPTHQSSVRASIMNQAASLAKSGGYYAGKNTIAEIGAVYAPPGAGNDPNKTNHTWPGHVARIYAEMGGGAGGEGYLYYDGLSTVERTKLAAQFEKDALKQQEAAIEAVTEAIDQNPQMLDGDLQDLIDEHDTALTAEQVNALWQYYERGGKGGMTWETYDNLRDYVVSGLDFTDEREVLEASVRIREAGLPIEWRDDLLGMLTPGGRKVQQVRGAVTEWFDGRGRSVFGGDGWREARANAYDRAAEMLREDPEMTTAEAIRQIRQELDGTAGPTLGTVGTGEAMHYNTEAALGLLGITEEDFRLARQQQLERSGLSKKDAKDAFVAPPGANLLGDEGTNVTPE